MAQKLLEISPRPNGYRLYNQNTQHSWGGSMFNPPGGNGRSSNVGFKHLLKNEATSKVRTLKLYAYFDTLAQANAALYQIKVGNQTNDCKSLSC